MHTKRRDDKCNQSETWINTYTTSLASSHIIWRAGFETWVTHENGGFDVVAGDGARAGDALLWVAVSACAIVSYGRRTISWDSNSQRTVSMISDPYSYVSALFLLLLSLPLPQRHH